VHPLRILSPFFSISAVISHVPYFMGFFMATIGRSGSLRRANEFGRGSVSKRLGVGASRRDLFYYLVRPHIESDTFTSLKPDYRVARSSLRPSVPLTRTLRKTGRWL
jgi:hypothetical protein